MKHIFCALLLLVAVAPAGGVVAATPENSTTNTTTTEETDPGVSVDVVETEEPAVEAIDANTRILSARYDDETGMMVLELESDRPQSVTLTDAGGVLDGGEVHRKTVRLYPGKNRVEVAVTEVDGRVAATIDTGDVLYAKVVRSSVPLLGGPWDKTDVQTSALSGLFAGLLVTGLIGFRRVRGVTDDPERLL